MISSDEMEDGEGTLDMPAAPNKDAGIGCSFKYQPGTIKKLSLHNFMCHEKFELELGPRVNFIIGPNGSGKSALLTALVVVLGGRATTTSRARKASDFVQYDIDQAYKPHEYGKEILIEKTIWAGDLGTTRLVIRDEKGARVSELSSTLHDILEHFKILINNPICILNQEISKTFLHSKKPEDKFSLYMKATNLEQIETDYEEAKEAHHKWDGVNAKKALSFKLLNKEGAECNEKINFIQNRLKLEARSDKLNIEYLWAVVRDLEENSKALVSKNETITRMIGKKHQEIDEREEGRKLALTEIEQFRAKIKSLEDLTTITKKKIQDIREKSSSVKISSYDVKRAIDVGESKLKRLKSDKDQIERKIRAIRAELGRQDSQAAEEERRKQEQKQLEEEISAEKNSEQTKRQHSEHLSRSMATIRLEMQKANLGENELTRKLNSKNSSLRLLIGGRDNELRKYGDYMVKICAQVDAAHSRGLFKEKPRGPLGYFIKLKTPKVAKALEIHLGRNAHAFTCDNLQDLAKLRSIIQNVKANSMGDFRDPVVLTRKFCPRHDVKKFEASSSHYSTLLDLIDIEDDHVFNALVDKTSLESVLFIEDYFEAQNVMITPSSVPRGTRCAYTLEGHVMHPRTNRGGFRSTANNRRNLCLFTIGNDDQIKELQREIAEIKLDIERCNARLDSLKAQYAEHRQDVNASADELKIIQTKLRAKEERLFKLKTTMPAVQPQELNDLEQELEDFFEQIRDTQVNIENQRPKLEAIKSELEDLDQKKSSALEILKQRENDEQKMRSVIDHKKELIEEHKHSIEQIKLEIDNLENQFKENETKLENLYNQISTATTKQANLERPPVIRSTEVIRAEQKKLRTQLQVEIDESQDPETLLAMYKKRVEEIGKTQALKDHNLRNFNKAGKSLKDRDEGLNILRNHTCGSVSSTFSSLMHAMDMEGKLCIHVNDLIVDGQVMAKARTLEMSVDTSKSQRPGTLSTNGDNTETPARDRRATRSQPAPAAEEPRSKRARLALSPSEKENQRMTDTRSLSGGERSFSTVAFVLSLWHHCASPFKLMDEIDVFMDMVTRRMSYNALIKFAESAEHPGQFIYFSPLQLPEIDATKGLVKVMKMPSITRSGQSQASSLRANGQGGDANLATTQ